MNCYVSIAYLNSNIIYASRSSFEVEILSIKVCYIVHYQKPYHVVEIFAIVLSYTCSLRGEFLNKFYRSVDKTSLVMLRYFNLIVIKYITVKVYS